MKNLFRGTGFPSEGTSKFIWGAEANNDPEAKLGSELGKKGIEDNLEGKLEDVDALLQNPDTFDEAMKKLANVVEDNQDMSRSYAKALFAKQKETFQTIFDGDLPEGYNETIEKMQGAFDYLVGENKKASAGTLKETVQALDVLAKTSADRLGETETNIKNAEKEAVRLTISKEGGGDLVIEGGLTSGGEVQIAEKTSAGIIFPPLSGSDVYALSGKDGMTYFKKVDEGFKECDAPAEIQNGEGFDINDQIVDKSITPEGVRIGADLNTKSFSLKEQKAPFNGLGTKEPSKFAGLKPIETKTTKEEEVPAEEDKVATFLENEESSEWRKNTLRKGIAVLDSLGASASSYGIDSATAKDFVGEKGGLRGVQQLQGHLVAAGFDLKNDGLYGDNTEKAWGEYQELEGAVGADLVGEDKIAAIKELKESGDTELAKTKRVTEIKDLKDQWKVDGLDFTGEGSVDKDGKETPFFNLKSIDDLPTDDKFPNEGNSAFVFQAPGMEYRFYKGGRVQVTDHMTKEIKMEDSAPIIAKLREQQGNEGGEEKVQDALKKQQLSPEEKEVLLVAKEKFSKYLEENYDFNGNSWAGTERVSRNTFVDAVSRIAGQNPLPTTPDTIHSFMYTAKAKGDNKNNISYGAYSDGWELSKNKNDEIMKNAKKWFAINYPAQK